MKNFLIISFIFLSIGAYGQVFLDSPDYVYGVASSKNEQEADSVALLSLAKCLNVKISNVSNYTYEESKYGVNETYFNNVQVISDVEISGIKKYVEKKRRVYTVYYYFNKQEYIDYCIEQYDVNISRANKVKELSHSHAKNLRLGHLYMAYCAVSDKMLETLYPYANILKKNACDEITDVYLNMGLPLFARNYGLANPSGIMTVKDVNSDYLLGFEYKTSKGEWATPVTFCDEDNNDCDKYVAKMAYIYGNTETYRFLFEVDTPHGIVKLEVPDEFYLGHTNWKHFIY